MNNSGLEYAIELLPLKLHKAIMFCSQKKMIDEIRLCVNKPFCITILSKPYMLSENGRITEKISEALIVDSDDIDFSFKAACQHSVYSFENQIAKGFITTKGANRVGISGTAVIKDNKVFSLKNINSLNIRISRQVIGCAQKVYDSVFENKAVSLLIAGKPSSGKTTLLRDLSRILGNSHRISIIDRRNEICSVFDGIPYNDTGTFCDIFTMYPDGEDIMSAIKSMSPEYLICDEIGTKADLNLLLFSINSGVKLICTTHAGSLEDALNREYITPLIKRGVFDKAIYINRDGNSFSVAQKMDLSEDIQ